MSTHERVRTIPHLLPTNAVAYGPCPPNMAGIVIRRQDDLSRGLTDFSEALTAGTLAGLEGRVVCDVLPFAVIEPEEMIDLTKVIYPYDERGLSYNALCRQDEDRYFSNPVPLRWIVVRGGVNPIHPGWVRKLRDDCRQWDVPLLFTDWGHYGPGSYNMSEKYACFREFTNFGQWVDKAPTWVNGGTCIDLRGRICRRGADFQKALFPVAVIHKWEGTAFERSLNGEFLNGVPAELGAEAVAA